MKKFDAEKLAKHNLKIVSATDSEERVRLEADSEKCYCHRSSDFDAVLRDVIERIPQKSIQFVNERKLQKTVATLQQYFIPEYKERRIAYAIKSNPRMNLLIRIDEFGIKAYDCASGGEIFRIHEFFPESEILYNHPVCRNKDRAFAIEKGVKHYTIDSSDGLQQMLDCLGDISPSEIELVLRVETPNPESKVDLSSKFGCAVEDAVDLLREIKEHGFIPGIYCHTGSQNTSAKTYEAAIIKLAEIARSAGGVNILNIGGGLPVNYFPSDSFELQGYLEVISNAIRKHTNDIFLVDDPKIIIEPGRGIIATACDLYIPILKVDEDYILIDDYWYGSFSDSAIHNWLYHFESTAGDGRELSKEKKRFKVVGIDYISSSQYPGGSGIVFGESELPVDVSSQDYVFIKHSGAYMDVQASVSAKQPVYLHYNLVESTIEKLEAAEEQSD